MRGDVAEAQLWSRAGDLMREHRIESDADTGHLFDDPPPGTDPEILKRLRQMYEAGGWGLVEAAIVDFPPALARVGRGVCAAAALWGCAGRGGRDRGGGGGAPPGGAGLPSARRSDRRGGR